METDNYTPPLVILGVEPLEKILIDNFFSEINNPIYTLLKDPPYLRYAGWNLVTLDQPKIVNGKCWEVKNGERKTVRLYRDGSLVAIAYADDSFLGWGKNHENFLKLPKLNSLAIIEYVYEFVEFYRNVISHFPKLTKVRFKIGIKNTGKWEGKELYLGQFEIGTFSDSFGKEDPSMSAVTNDFYEFIEVPLENGTYDSRFIAYKIAVDFFIHFNIPSNKIPYTKRDDKDERYIDIDKIKSI